MSKKGERLLNYICSINLTEKEFDKLSQKEKNHIIYMSKRDIALKQCKKYRDSHKDNYDLYKKKYVMNHHDKRLESQKRYRETHKEQIHIYNMSRREKVAEYNKKYIKENREKLNEKSKLYMRKRREEIEFRITHSLRSRLYSAIKEQNTRKDESTLELVGCSISELKKHLESTFKEGMTWDNYGEWHIDHIIPCIAFDLTNKEEQKKCFHFSNLQALWAEENEKKGSLLNGERLYKKIG